jgi:hypothetical protein
MLFGSRVAKAQSIRFDYGKTLLRYFERLTGANSAELFHTLPATTVMQQTKSSAQLSLKRTLEGQRVVTIGDFRIWYGDSQSGFRRRGFSDRCERSPAHQQSNWLR